MDRVSTTMRAAVLDHPHQGLRLTELPVPDPGPGQVLLRVRACGVCRTDLHIVDGELPTRRSPLVPGHQVVATVVGRGPGGLRFADGARVGVGWLGWADGTCRFCLAGQENLCPNARFTGYTVDGGYAEYMVADERFCYPIPDRYSDVEAAPLLCPGLIGYRCLRLAGDAPALGLYGFGAAATIAVQVARHRGQRIYAFVRRGDDRAAAYALEMGAEWAGDSLQPGPVPLDAAIIFAPVGELIPAALRAVRPGGAVVCGGIHMSDIPSFSYDLLWEERVLRSVANLTRADGEEFLALAPRVPIRTVVEAHPLGDANVALDRLRRGDVRGSAVLVTDGS
jgi:alcohol dehydrogenase, propanol-preferring